MRNLTLGFELAQSLERHHAVEVLSSERRIDMQVVYADLARCCGSRKNSIGRIGGPGVAPLDLLIKRPVGL
jgi:hypothetical protein